MNEIRTNITDRRANLIMSALGKIVVRDLRRNNTNMNYRVLKKINNYLNMDNQKILLLFIIR
jgi:hypothetical protein